MKLFRINDSGSVSDLRENKKIVQRLQQAVRCDDLTEQKSFYIDR